MLNAFLKDFCNIPGWTTKRKIVVFESDDWGSTRFKDKETRDFFIKIGYKIDQCWMSMYDAIESDYDIRSLLEVISDFHDFKGNRPAFTLYFNPANPDFEKIKLSNFEEYFYETVEKTYKIYGQSDNVMDLYKEAIINKKISIQFHGREHLYVNRWMRELQQGQKDTILGFNHQFWGFSKSFAPGIKKSYRSAFDLDLTNDLIGQKETLISGVAIISKLFNSDPKVFVAPDGPFSLKLIDSVINSNIRYIGLPKIHLEPMGAGTVKKRFFWLGEKLRTDLTVITRNAIFEPSSPRQSDWLGACMHDIKNAFTWHKPSVISTHRANYIGRIDPTNRDKNLSKLVRLLNNILKTWPDVEFMTSEMLGDLIVQSKR